MFESRGALAWVVLLCLVVVLQSVFVGSYLPPWQGPDEPRHYEYLVVLDNVRRPVSFSDADLVLQQQVLASMYRYKFWHYLGKPTPESPSESFEALWGPSATLLHRPPLYYALLLPIFSLIRDFPVDHQLFLLRIANGVLLVPAVALTYWAGRIFWPARPDFALASASIIALTPQYVVATSILNSDSLLGLVGALATVVAIRHVQVGWSVKAVVGLVALLVFALLVKRTAMVMAPLFLAAFVLSRWQVSQLVRLAIAGVGILIVAAATTLALGPDSGVVSGVQALALRLYFDSPEQFSRLLSSNHFSPDALALHQINVLWLFKTYWAYLGWAARPAPDVAYVVLIVALVVVMTGAIWALATPRVHWADRRVAVTLLVGLVGSAVIVLVFYSLDNNPLAFPQGRYVFPLMPALSLIWAAGVYRLLNDRSIAIAAVLLPIGAFNLWYTFGFAIPYFYLAH